MKIKIQIQINDKKWEYSYFNFKGVLRQLCKKQGTTIKEIRYGKRTRLNIFNRIIIVNELLKRFHYIEVGKIIHKNRTMILHYKKRYKNAIEGFDKTLLEFINKNK